MRTRRGFLKVAALTALAAALPRLGFASGAAGTTSVLALSDALPLTLPFVLGGDCEPIPTATIAPPLPTPYRIWLPHVDR